ncbi:unnamed protein product [Cuscuta campestris]|uniref:DNA (cytosine-5-)-methyltransferase n=1 Tax=Cuscuta campestris TaxID=132261 RepID=A0A484MJZ7_9ASTE|nr:unnamed protein product [Cuscuta campestris]
MGMLAAGAYGLPQFRMRVFLSAALQGKKLPKFPLPTHKVDSRGVILKEFECNNVDYENSDVNLKDALFLEDAISDLPMRKGANFRDLPGVHVVGNKVELDPNVERVYLPSGKPLVPNYAISFVKGNSTKPFKRLWWDETVPTVVTRAEPHNQAICHPVQDRVLTVRENARLQAFLITKSFVAPSKTSLSKEATMFTLPEGYGAIQELPADQTSSAEFPN